MYKSSNLIKSSLPAFDKTLFSNMWFYLEFLWVVVNIGELTVFWCSKEHLSIWKGISSFVKPSIPYILVWMFSLTSQKYVELLSKLAINPEACENSLKHSNSNWTELTSLLQKIRESSAKQNCIAFTFSHLGWNLNFRCDISFFRSLDKYSMSITKKKGTLENITPKVITRKIGQ